MSDYQGPLSRFTVIDLTRVRSGPTAVRHLADWGANVIKVEAPAAVDKSKGMGGARNGPDYQHIHRNKRSLTLNLKEEAGRAESRGGREQGAELPEGGHMEILCPL